MATSSPQLDRAGLKRTSSNLKSYVDLTLSDDSDEEEEQIEQSTSKQQSKRKRIVESTPPASEEEAGNSDDELGDEEYEIDYIVNSRFRTTRGRKVLEFLIHWKGYPKEDRSWTLASQFEDDDPPVAEFYDKNPKKPGAKPTNAHQASPRKLTPAKLTPARSTTTPSRTTRTTPAKPVDSSPPKKSSQPLMKGGDLRSYFGVQPKGKENVDIGSSSKREVKKATPRQDSARKEPKLKPAVVEKSKPKKRKSDSDESDFVLGDALSSDDEGSEAEEKSDSEDAGVNSDDLESEEEVKKAPKKPAAAGASKAKNGGWGGKKSGGVAKQAPPKAIHGFKTGVQDLKGGDANAKNLSDHLPPLHDIEMMFDHLISRVPDVVKLVEHLNGRALRVATMCSGTESPLLALNMMAKALKAQHGMTLSFDHVFSCEIEPFKQAYIERNFSPPILFRDVTELGKKRAHTAYGSLVEVPGNVDLLIAGTSCVDYSNLNNQQQGIDANGESGRTFRGMLQWVKKHQPPIVILENVCNAPWDAVVEYFAQINYDARHMRLDTKEYYIPHTRTRVYLFATPMQDGKQQHLTDKWAATVKDMRRGWSAPFEAFLLPTDDANIHRARLDLTAAKELKDGNQRKATDWNRCESRHHRARLEEQLGVLRPLTAWQEAGVCKGLDWTWNDWLQSQTERVVDLLDISTLRMAKEGIDSGFKACIWNVSQNVDRQTGSGKTALAPCLTPNMIPWVTIRGGPVTGREALALQGIPVRELLLTSENEDQLADLAGNAMTTTVVGTAMISALRVARHRLTEGDNAEADAARIENELEERDDVVSNRIIGENVLEKHVLDLAKVETADLAEILDLAERSSRHCQCEGQSGTVTPILECSTCAYRACKTCGGRPDHHYEPCENQRVEPGEFEKKFKNLLPMRVKIAGITDSVLDELRSYAEDHGKGSVEEKDWKIWTAAVQNGVDGAEFRFRSLKRQDVWTAVYEAPNAILDLFLRSKLPEWRLTIKAPTNEPVNSRLRALLLHPVARLRFDTKGHDVLCGPWELCIPSNQSFNVEIIGKGEKVPSWYASLGLQGEFVGTTRWSQLEVVVPPEGEVALDRPLSGTYTLLPRCGQAMNSLHKKEDSAADKDLPALFLFLDPSRCGEVEQDSYVFSTSTERLNFGMERAVEAVLDTKWRETSKAKETVRLNVRGGWVKCKAAHLTAIGGSDIKVVSALDEKAERDAATYAIPPTPIAVVDAIERGDCQHASALLSCRVPLDAGHSEAMWSEAKWGEIDLLHQGNATFANLAWITERIPALNSLSGWNKLSEVNAEDKACDRCAPRPPKIHWMKKLGKLNKNGKRTASTIFAFEDRLEAGRYEHALKNRPTPFILQLRLDEQIGSFRIGLNIVSLAHRALARLPPSVTKGQTQLSWRLTPGQIADTPQPPRVFILPSNKKDPQHAQPKSFLLPLRKEQLRSLWWMLEQEKAEGKTHTFIEEEISESALPALGWRAEGKAERPVMIRGGVIADQVGYGKTIISLALIAETKGLPQTEPAPAGLIDLKATLIVVPGHLSKQWPSEIKRFTGSNFHTVVIQTMRDLNECSIMDLAKADIIVMASDIFESDMYWQRFEYLSAQPQEWLNDGQGGRFFADRLDTAINGLRTQTEKLQEGGDAAAKAMKTSQQKAKEDAENRTTAHKAANFGKRMKGQAYRDRYDAEADKKKSKATKEEIERWEASEDESEEEDETEAVPAPTFRSASGAQAYSSEKVQDNYKRLHSPVMHMFRFRRVIADEFTYLEKKTLASVLRLSSCYKWVLSGTPPVNDFPAIRSIAAFMGIHLGVEDDAEGSAQAQKARAKEQTAAEKFHAFREVHSAAWHRRRDDLAQEFLNVFVRQNIAEIEDIPTAEHIHHIKLPASEGAVYLELEHHLQALEMQARKETKFKNVTVGDRNARLEEALSDSRTAEEALLKRCCHFTLDLTDKTRDAKSAQEACEHIAGARSKQLIGCEKDLYKTINGAVALHLYIRRKGQFGKNDEDRQPFREWVDFSFDKTKHQGDAEAAQKLVAVLEKCGFRDGAFPDEAADGQPAKVEKGATVEDVKWQLREQSHLLRRLSKELVARVRSLRFFEVVRKLQRNGDEAKEVLEASACGHSPSTKPGIEMAVLSCCGHVACLACMKKSADAQGCVKGADCSAAVRHTNIVKVSTLGIEGELSSGRYGAKLQRLVDLIHSIPRSERILVFLQWDDLAGKVSEALTAGRIRHLTLTGAAKSRANTLDAFQQGDAETDRVLLLKMNDASAAGSNLTTANHAIFLGPLFTPSLLNYRATETQAIGRVRRYGQEKKVHIHRLLALDTIDMTIFEGRRAELRAKPDYVEIPQEVYVGKKAAARKSEVVVEIISPKKRQKTNHEDVIEID